MYNWDFLATQRGWDGPQGFVPLPRRESRLELGAASCSPERPATAWVGQSCRGCGWGQVLDPVHDARGQADTRITAGTMSGKAETPAKGSSSVSLGLEKERRAQRGHGLCSKALLSLSYASLGDAKTAYSRGTLTSVTEPCGRTCRFFFFYSGSYGLTKGLESTSGTWTLSPNWRQIVQSGDSSWLAVAEVVHTAVITPLIRTNLIFKLDRQAGELYKHNARVLGIDYG